MSLESKENLVECPDCGGMVSIYARTCPHCGRDKIYKFECSILSKIATTVLFLFFCILCALAFYLYIHPGGRGGINNKIFAVLSAILTLNFASLIAILIKKS